MATLVRSLETPAWGRLVLAWLALAVVMSLNGIFRELALRPLFGSTAASVLSATLGVLLLLVATRILFPPLGSYGTASLALVSVLLVVLTVAFETTLGIVVDYKSLPMLLDHYALWRGELWPIVLAVLALTPFIWGRWWPAR